jgi:hypothetical protein
MLQYIPIHWWGDTKFKGWLELQMLLRPGIESAIVHSPHWGGQLHQQADNLSRVKQSSMSWLIPYREHSIFHGDISQRTHAVDGLYEHVSIET